MLCEGEELHLWIWKIPSAGELFRNGHRIIGFRIASPDELRQALALVFAGRVAVPVDRTFRLAEAADAHRYLDERRHVGKIVLVA